VVVVEKHGGRVMSVFAVPRRTQMTIDMCLKNKASLKITI